MKITQKKCTLCNEVKDTTQFYKNKNASDGLKSQCKGCHINGVKVWKSKNKDKVQLHSKVSNHNWRKNNPNYV